MILRDIQRYTKKMQNLSDITHEQTRYICQALHDVLPEYSSDTLLVAKIKRIIQRLTENHSMYQFSSEELDTICMGLNDCCYVLDDILQDLEECDIPEGREYRSELESIAAFLSKLQRDSQNTQYTHTSKSQRVIAQAAVNETWEKRVLEAYSPNNFQVTNELPKMPYIPMTKKITKKNFHTRIS